MTDDFDYYDPRPCDHCGAALDLREVEVDEPTGWFTCPECEELNCD